MLYRYLCNHFIVVELDARQTHVFQERFHRLFVLVACLLRFDSYICACHEKKKNILVTLLLDHLINMSQNLYLIGKDNDIDSDNCNTFNMNCE